MDASLWVIINHDIEKHLPLSLLTPTSWEDVMSGRIYKQAYFRTREEAKTELESYYEAIARSMNLFDLAQVERKIKDVFDWMKNKEKIQNKVKEYKKLRSTLNNCSDPWTQIAHYYLTEIDEDNCDVQFMAIQKISPVTPN